MRYLGYAAKIYFRYDNPFQRTYAGHGDNQIVVLNKLMEGWVELDFD